MSEPTTKKIDLAALKLASTAKIELKHPTSGDRLGIFLLIAGKDSETFKSAMRDRYAKRIASVKQHGDANPTSDDIDAENLTLLTRCVLGFENVVVDGEELEFSPEAARELLATYPWIYEQVDMHVGDRGNFLRS